MFTLLSGPFHPHLEYTLLETVRRIKAADPRAPFAIVVPSESLRRRLQWLLSVEHERALFDVHFLTFHQLALRLYSERRAVSLPDVSVPSLELVGDIFYEYALTLILQQEQFVSNPFALHAQSLGLCPAVWRTIQDLREAHVEPNVVLRGLHEHVFDEMARECLQGVFTLHAVIQDWSRQLRVGLPDDLTDSVISWVSHSPFISRLSSVIYYGFYDITQVQLSLLEEISRATTVTVFFPLVSGEASQFAQRFLDRYLLKAGVIHRSLQDPAHTSSLKCFKNWSPKIHVVNAVGPEGELTFTCKAIMEHVEKKGHAWHEIGIVARNLEPYLTYLPRIFEAHRIPFGITATRPMLEEPVAKVWWILAGLREEQFGCRSMLDVVSSSWFGGIATTEESVQVNSHLWGQAVHHFRLVGGVEDWERLAHVAQDSAAIQEWHQSSRVSLEQATASLHVFATVVSGLVADCLALPAMGSIRELTQAFETLMTKQRCFPTDHPSCFHDETYDERTEYLVNGFEQVITSLQQLDRLDQHVTWEQWMVLFRSILERTRLPLPGDTSMGVQVLDVMAARGRPFRTLFVLGMNDHVFPRIVREDAFLRDHDRKVLAESLGYKIDEKMTGFDEETLLFSLLQQSAREDMYLLYQRADQNGRPLMPSSFLRDHLAAAAAQRADQEITVPIGLLERSKTSYFSSDYDTSQDSRLSAVLEGRPLDAMVSEASSWWTMLQYGMKIIGTLEQTGSQAGLFDGITNADNLHWQDLVARGLSPTALGTYAQCPMRYWMTHVLKVQGGLDPMSQELPSRVWGELVHQVLCGVYQDLSTCGWPQQIVPPVHRTDIVNAHAKIVFQAYAQRFGKGYWLFWEWMKARLTRMMMLLIEYDHRDFLEHGWIPGAYEVEATGMFPSDSQTSPELLKLRGRFDRVDTTMDHSCERIVDYKVSLRRSFHADELDLVTKALHGQQLQPPLYSFMAPRTASRVDGLSTTTLSSVNFRYLRPLQEEAVRSASFSGALWDTPTGEQLKRTIQGWVQGIRSGQFFILPGAYCRSCSYATACRFQHHPSWARAYGLPLARAYRQVRKQKVCHD